MNAPVIGLAPARSLPQSAQAEKTFLGGCMLAVHPERIAEWVDRLPADAFYAESHQRLWTLMGGMVRRGHPIGSADIIEEILNRSKLNPDHFGGLVYIGDLEHNGAPTTESLHHYATEIATAATRRGIIFAARQIEDIARDTSEEPEEMFAALEKLLTGILKGSVALGHGWESYEEAMGPHLAVLRERIAAFREGRPIGMSSPWSTLDRLTGPMSRGNVTVIAARPGMGKTGLALEIAAYLAGTAGPVALISLEMPTGQLLDRQIAGLSGVWQSKIRDGDVTPYDFEAMIQAMDKLASMPILVTQAAAVRGDLMVAHIRQAQIKAERQWGSPLAAVVLDYLQLVPTQGRSREEEVSRLARMFKVDVARGMDLHVVELAQLSRKPEERRDKRPQLQDLRESGAVEQEADTVILPFRKEVYRGQGVFTDEELSDPGLVELIVAKARHGTPGSAWLRWDLQANRIREVDDERVGWPS